MRIIGVVKDKAEKIMKTFPGLISEEDGENGIIIIVPEKNNMIASYEARYGHLTLWLPDLTDNNKTVVLTTEEFYKVEII